MSEVFTGGRTQSGALARRSRLHRVLIGAVVVSVTAWVLLLSSSADAATCDPEYADFLTDGGTLVTHGVTADIYSQDQVITSACQTNAFSVAHGTAIAEAHFSPQTWVEIGWLVGTNSAGGHYFKLFTEWGKNGAVISCGGVICPYNSGCVFNGGLTTFRVQYTGSGNWNMSYACAGGGFTLRDSTGTAYGVVSGASAIESGRHDGSQHIDEFDNTQTRTTSGQWKYWSQIPGTAFCGSDGDPSWGFFANVGLADSYIADAGSGQWC